MRPLGRWKRRVSDDRGFTIVEVCVAAFVLAVGVTTVVGSMGIGMGLVGHSRQRSAGAGVAQERLERARNVAYDDLALNEDPTHNAEASHPDHNVIENGAGPEDDQFRLAGGTLEPLLINTADGGLKHLDDPFTLANTEFMVHQFVSWVSDLDAGDTEPTITGIQSYKRVTVVVTWKFPVHTGPRHTVTESTFVSDGTVTVPTVTPSPSPFIPPPSGGGGSNENLGQGTFLGNLLSVLFGGGGGGGSEQCGVASSPPVFESGVLLSGSGTDQGYLNSTSVQFRFEGSDPECHPISLHLANVTNFDACNDPNLYVEVQTLAGGGEPPPVNVTWQVPAGDGFKSVCAVFQNKDDQLSQVWGVNVKLDQTQPSVPGNFRQQSCTLEGNDRIATFDWNASTDANFNGYRLYRSIESGAYQLLSQTTNLSISDTSPKNYASVRYLIRSYDKAGNESNDSAQVISYSKNKC